MIKLTNMTCTNYFRLNNELSVVRGESPIVEWSKQRQLEYRDTKRAFQDSKSACHSHSFLNKEIEP